MKRRNKFEKKKVKKEEAKYLTELQKNARLNKLKGRVGSSPS